MFRIIPRVLRQRHSARNAAALPYNVRAKYTALRLAVLAMH